MKDPLGVTLTVWEPAVMPLQLILQMKRHRERTKTSQFAADDGPIGSNQIHEPACPDATASWSPTERPSKRTKTSQFVIKEAKTESLLIDLGA